MAFCEERKTLGTKTLATWATKELRKLKAAATATGASTGGGQQVTAPAAAAASWVYQKKFKKNSDTINILVLHILASNRNYNEFLFFT
ncbi:unnamed protein product [Callosobruchus maculatus]|uniref:Uncharacterized protein n=1 Tax=Callosobruchus maculatus TaxID=64391 RepID=A0A653DUX8_CALMS|nr:unnamed protein product [Callosobruchus maculatus]